MFELLILIILISIVFGVSLHSAFWGLVAFSVGAIALYIVAAIVGLGASVIIDKFKQANTPKAKQIRRAKWSQKLSSVLEGILIFLLAIAPFILGALLASLSNGNLFVALILAALPFCAELFWLYKYAQKLLDKKQRGV